MYRSRRWPKAQSTPIARWGSPCAAAISVKAWRASWRNGRRGLRGSEGVRTVVQQPVFAQVGFAGHHASPFGITWLRHAKPEGRSVRRGLLESELLPKPVFAQVGFAGHHASPFGITWLRHAKPEGRSVRRGLLESELLPKPVFAH